MINELETNGYVHLKNILTDDEYNYGLNCINDNKIDYSKMKLFIENQMLNHINNIFDKNCHYTKFRFSNNNNSDAGAIHKDIFHVNDKNHFNLYTCLTYFDKTIMEIYPKTHNNIKRPFFQESIYLTLEPTDVLIFNSTLLHRGIFTENLANRRLLQVFDIFLDNETYQNNKNKIVHVKTNTKNNYSNDVLEYLYKIKSITYVLNLIGYINAIDGYGYNENIRKTLNLNDDISYLASEGLTARITILPDTYQEINKYVIVDKDINSLPIETYDKYYYICYQKNMINILIMLLIIIASIIFIYKVLTK